VQTVCVCGKGDLGVLHSPHERHPHPKNPCALHHGRKRQGLGMPRITGGLERFAGTKAVHLQRTTARWVGDTATRVHAHSRPSYHHTRTRREHGPSQVHLLLVLIGDGAAENVAGGNDGVDIAGTNIGRRAMDAAWKEGAHVIPLPGSLGSGTGVPHAHVDPPTRDGAPFVLHIGGARASVAPA